MIFDSGTSMHDDFSHLVDLSNPRIRDRHSFLEDDEDESSDGAAGKTIFDSGTSMYEGSSISLIYLTYSVSVFGLSVRFGEFSQSIPGITCQRPNTHSVFFHQLHAELLAILHIYALSALPPSSPFAIELDQVVMDKNSWAEAEEAKR